MLETKNLTKIYKPKKGVPVTAIDKVNIKFPETGMIFLLGKSGSGKSTLLNLLGGLDSYDDGEIIIKGVSSKSFHQKHFDSYRNTYVGFIFQEYNVLDEFSVGANIALAIELQGRKADDTEINKILKQVDLEDFGNRKPNELSGGQKQRVAIARALVKNPQIIMADEPTGALDSVTGKQVFDTLKKLSNEKLVIIVSHDRDFAETYADRIIELSDGKILSDVTVCNDYSKDTDEKINFDGNVVTVDKGYHLTEDDRIMINEYIDSLKSGITINIANKGIKSKFLKTDVSKIPEDKDKSFKLIKSKLPLKNAFKIGASGLKHKKIRLVITIFLSCISFGLFGLSDTFASYNHIKTCTNSIVDTGVNYASLGKTKRVKDGNHEYFANQYEFNNAEIEKIKNDTGIDFVGVHAPYNRGLELEEYTNPEVELTETDYEIYIKYLNGFCEADNDMLGQFGFKLSAGVLPDGTKNEIALSEYTCKIFKKTGFFDGTTEKDKDGNVKKIYIPINNSSDMLGKKIKLCGTEYTVSGVIDTNMDLSRYENLTVEKKGQSTADELVDFALYGEFASEIGYSLSNACFVGEGKIADLKSQEPPISNIYNGYVYFYGEGDDYSLDPMYITKLEDALSQPIIWADTERNTLSEKEIIITSDLLYRFAEKGDEAYQKYLSDAEEKYYESLYSEISDEEMPEIPSASIYKPDSKTLAAAESRRTEAYKKVLLELKNCTFSGVNREKSNDYVNIEGYRVVGVIPISESNEKWGATAVLCDSLYKDFTIDGLGDYNFIVGKMPKSRQDVKKLVSFCYERDGKNIAYDLQNSVTFELDTVNTTVKELAKIFLYIGLGFALFAALMLSNFIATSISYKKQEIGILRAIGSRSNDVFRIFFAESFIIAMINFVLSAVGVFAATAIINTVLRKEVRILITVLSFGVRQVVLILAVSILVAFVASFIPVKKIASKKPIDAIRDR